MNKEQYAAILERQLSREDKENEEKAKNNSFYKAIDRTIKKLEKELAKLRKRRDAKAKARGWADKYKIVEKFKADWDYMSLILDNAKRTKVKNKLLKEYKLFR